MLARNIAKAMIERKKLNAWQLQKLLFYAQSLSLYLNNTVLFDDAIKVWKDGPVVQDVYTLYKNNDLQYMASIDDNDTISHLILDYTFKYFGKKTGRVLRDMTHAENSAWSRVVKEKNINNNFEIVKADIPLPYIKEEMNLYPHIIAELTKPAEINKRYIRKDVDKLMEIL